MREEAVGRLERSTRAALTPQPYYSARRVLIGEAEEAAEAGEDVKQSGSTRGARHTLTQLRHTLPQLRHHTAPTTSTTATSLVYRDYMSIPVCMCAAYTTMHIPGAAREKCGVRR